MSLKNNSIRTRLVKILNDEMNKQGVASSELARRMNLSSQEITKRTINKWRAGETFNIDGVELALRKLGVNIRVSYENDKGEVQ